LITIKEYVNNLDNKRNYTTMFLMPALGVNFSNMPKQFISSFLIDGDRPQIVLILDTSGNIKNPLELFETRVKADLIRIDSFPDTNEIAYIYDFPPRYRVDYNLFMIGMFSKLSIKYKELLLNQYGRITGNGNSITMVDALFPEGKAREYRAKQLGVKVSDLPNGEVMSIPNMEYELYASLLEKINNNESSINIGGSTYEGE
jgi:hypothetical protein